MTKAALRLAVYRLIASSISVLICVPIKDNTCAVFHWVNTHLGASALTQALVVRHFLAIVVGHRQAHGRIQSIENEPKAVCSAVALSS